MSIEVFPVTLILLENFPSLLGSQRRTPALSHFIHFISLSLNISICRMWEFKAFQKLRLNEWMSSLDKKTEASWEAWSCDHGRSISGFREKLEHYRNGSCVPGGGVAHGIMRPRYRHQERRDHPGEVDPNVGAGSMGTENPKRTLPCCFIWDYHLNLSFGIHIMGKYR